VDQTRFSGAGHAGNSDESTERGREALIREKFPVVKEGEHVITVIPAPTEPATN
jgi:hypothetical protein